MGGEDVGGEDEAEGKAEADAAVAAASPVAAESGEAKDVVFSAARLEVERKRRRIIEGG